MPSPKPENRPIGALLAAALIALPLAACAGPQTRVEQGLVDAGLEPVRAACMADILVDRLSVGQLRKLGELADVRKQGDDTSIGDLLAGSDAFRDPEILAAAGEALVRCPD